MTLREFVIRCWRECPAERGDGVVLAEWLYRHCFTRRRVSPSVEAEDTPTGTRMRDDVVAALTMANACPSVWVGAPDVVVEGEDILTTYEGLDVRARPTEWRGREGTFEICVPQYVVGDDDWYRADFAGFTALRDIPLARVYVDVTPDGAVALLRAVSRTAITEELVCRLKCALDPAEYRRRCDRCVIYFRRTERERFVRCATEIVHALSLPTQRGTGIVPLTQPIAPGLSYAEDPAGTGESFGQQRCRLMAEALQQCPPHAAEEDVYLCVCAVWRCHGLSPEKPWQDAWR